MSQIVYIGSFAFPLGDAVAKRVLGVGMALRATGYRVSFIGEDKDVPEKKVSVEREYDGFRYCSLHKPKSSKEHFDYREDVSIIKKLLMKWNEQETISAVFFCGMKCAFMANRVVSICKTMKIRTYADSMDWLQINTGNLVFDFIKQADIEFEMRYVNMRADGVMAISSYLSNYYMKRGKKAIVVPPLSPYDRPEKLGIKNNTVPVIVYAGIPCRLGQQLKNPHAAKDRLDIAVKMLYEVFLKGVCFSFEIYGLTENDYVTVFPEERGSVKKMIQAGVLSFKGFADGNRVKEAVINADFTILLREKNRTSMAGFPTKIAESITLGTPVITTDTSDICTYITNGQDGVILDLIKFDHSVNMLKSALCVHDIKKYKNQALENVAFSYNSYTDLVGSILQ